MPEGGGGLQKERLPEDAAEGSTEHADSLEGEQASLAGMRVQRDWAGSKIFGGDRSKRQEA